MSDERYVYSACCTWHGPISEVAQTKTTNVVASGKRVGVSLPCCPHCGSPLMEYPDRQKWDGQIAEFLRQHPDLPLYAEWMETLHGKCVPLKGWDWRAAYAEFERARRA